LRICCLIIIIKKIRPMYSFRLREKFFFYELVLFYKKILIKQVKISNSVIFYASQKHCQTANSKTLLIEVRLLDNYKASAVFNIKIIFRNYNNLCHLSTRPQVALISCIVTEMLGLWQLYFLFSGQANRIAQ